MSNLAKIGLTLAGVAIALPVAAYGLFWLMWWQHLNSQPSGIQFSLSQLAFDEFPEPNPMTTSEVEAACAQARLYDATLEQNQKRSKLELRAFAFAIGQCYTSETVFEPRNVDAPDGIRENDWYVHLKRGMLNDPDKRFKTRDHTTN